MAARIKLPPPRPLALIYAVGASPDEVAYLRLMRTRLVTAKNRGEPVGDLLKHVEAQLAILDTQ